eukprot:365665-Chlamydomonas_euryale.AAC.15
MIVHALNYFGMGKALHHPLPVHSAMTNPNLIELMHFQGINSCDSSTHLHLPELLRFRHQHMSWVARYSSYTPASLTPPTVWMYGTVRPPVYSRESGGGGRAGVHYAATPTPMDGCQRPRYRCDQTE